MFIRVYLCKSLDVKELRSSTKEFMANMVDNSLDILEKIHKDYSGIMASTSLKESDLSMARTSRRTEVHIKEERKPSAMKFPPNTGNKLPSHVYSQVKRWFELMTTPAAQRKPDFLDGFTYTHKKPEVKVVYRDRPKTQQSQRRGTNRSGSGSTANTERTTRRRKRKPRDSEDVSRSRSRDQDSDKHNNSAQGRSTARRSKRSSRSKSAESSQGSSKSDSLSSTSPVSGRRYSDSYIDTEDELEDKERRRNDPNRMVAIIDKSSPFES